MTFGRNMKLTKKQTHMKTEACKLYFRVFCIFLPNVIKINLYNLEPYRFKFCAFFLRHSVVDICAGAKHIWAMSGSHRWHAG